MARHPPQDIAVGAMFALALVILAFGIMVVGGESGLLFERAHYRIVFLDADGLMLGAPVRMAGVQIGTVSRIHLPTSPEEEGIEVQVSVDPTYAERLREDSRAALRLLQFLTAEKLIEITPGSPAAASLPENALIPTLESRGVLESGEATLDNLTEITVSLKNILRPLEQGEGLIGQMLHDPEFGKEGLEALRGTLQNAERLTGELLAGRGMVGRLLRDEELAAKLDQLALAFEDLSELLAAAAGGQNAVAELVREDGAARQAILDLRDSAAALRRVTAKLEAGEGLLGRLLNDTEYSEALAADLRTTASNVARITDKINAGEGTLGALINDSEIHEGAEELLHGMNDSKFTRWLLRNYRKRAVELEERETEAAEESRSEPEPAD